MPVPHPAELRQRTVELARQDVKPVAPIAKELGISESCLRNWMAQAEADENGTAPGRRSPLGMIMADVTQPMSMPGVPAPDPARVADLSGAPRITQATAAIVAQCCLTVRSPGEYGPK